MFKEIFLFELKYRLKRPMAYVFFVVFFAMTFAAVTSDAVQIGGGIGNVNRNSPFVIMQMLAVMSAIGVFVITAFMATAIVRDFEDNTYAMFFTTPIGKFDFLLGRFAGALVVSFLVLSGAALGIMLGSVMPWLEADTLGPFVLKPYLFSLFVLLLPNAILTGGLFFSLATLTCSMLWTYAGVIIFFAAYSIASAMLGDLENQTLAGLVDPFGFASFDYMTKYWTVAEKNTQTLPVAGNFLMNRLIWMGVGFAALFLTGLKFKFAEPINRFGRKRKKKIIENAEREVTMNPTWATPAVAQDFSGGASLWQYLNQTRIEFWGVVKSVSFIVIVGFGLFNFIAGSSVREQIFGTSIWPVTNYMLRNIQGSYVFILFIILTIFAGELVWKERSRKLHEVYDSLPIPNWLPFSAKLTALVLIQALLLVVAILAAIGFQTYHGYYRFELDLYFKDLFLVKFPAAALLCVLAIFFHVVANNKFIGYMLMVVYYIILMVLPALNWEHNLYQYGQTPQAVYSDMNGYGHFVIPLVWFNLYWMLFAVVLAVAAILYWVRGTDSGARMRTKIAGLRFKTPNRIAVGLATLAFIAIGSYIFYNTNVLNAYTTDEHEQIRIADYEKSYKKYKNFPQPRITAVQAGIDVFPKERRVEVRGHYVLKNKHARPIDSLHVLLDKDLVINKLHVPNGKLVMDDRKLGYSIYTLAPPLAPADTLRLDYDLAYVTRGFVNGGSNTDIVYNGTFINNIRYFPHIGYTSDFELQDRNNRKKRGLPPKERMAAVNDSVARRNTYISHEADWVKFETTVSTSPEQIAISPGYLQREWTENGRRYFHYKMDAPILNFYSFLSANYAVKRDKWNDVNIEIYYHAPHTYNLDKMIKSVKKSLDYFTANFSPYQHRQVRILEFPRYASFAQSFPNTIPYSEAIGFIANLKDEKDIDYVFYVTAHEVAHQWWAHQVISGDVQGATVMVETMAQYSALMVMEKEYGKDKMKKFLKYELDNYLQNRGDERIKELPLIFNENQGYIHYRKGSVIMYALRDYIGEEALNAALRKYIKAVAYQEPPYTNSLEFLSYLRQATPDSLQYILADMFETITLYENQTTQASYTPAAEGKYKVALTIKAKKLRADSLGVESEIPINDWIDIGVLGKDGKELYLKKHKIPQPDMTFDLLVDELPVEAGIDPYVKLIDRNPADNIKKIEKR
jgi:ABC-type transport system involved in multi-copper enzyme maturation permease subunit